MNKRLSSHVSKINLNTSNYSEISKIPRQLINQIRYEGEIYSQAPIRCEEFWKEIQKLQLTGGPVLHFKQIDQLFDKFREDFIQLLKIQNSKDLFEIFDFDSDGQISEDEQIMIFQIIKDKMFQVATNLLKVQEYQLFKQLMKELRNLEFKINQYQNELRQKIHQHEVQIYEQIGQEKLEEFYDKYFDKFNQLEQLKDFRRKKQAKEQNEELAQLEEKMSKDVEITKVKPKRKLKDLQVQEKLVSVDERVEEALVFRRELRDLERSEQVRVIEILQKRKKVAVDDLMKKFQKQKAQLEIKLAESEHNLTIQMKKDYDVLLKQIHLHSNEIERIQTLATKIALKKGERDGDLKRTKQRAKLQNLILAQTKIVKVLNEQSMENNEDEDKNPSKKITLSRKSSFKIDEKSPYNFEIIQSNDNISSFGTQQIFNPNQKKTIQNIINIKRTIKSNNVTNFYIRKKFGADLPVNFQAEPHKMIGDNHQRIEKFLMAKKQSPIEILPSITEFYEEDLTLRKLNSSAKNEEEIRKEIIKKKYFINDKLQNKDFRKQNDSIGRSF